METPSHLLAFLNLREKDPSAERRKALRTDCEPTGAIRSGGHSKVGLVVKMELKDGTVRCANGCDKWRRDGRRNELTKRRRVVARLTAAR